jgi:segregation and condensation protein B
MSLETLSEAFAAATGRAARFCSPPEQGAQVGQSFAGSDEDVLSPPALGDEPGDRLSPSPEQSPDDRCQVSPLTILEAMLFVGNRTSEPLTPGRAAELMRGVAAGEVADLVDQLNSRYLAGGCPYQIVSEGAGYRMALRREFSAVRAKFFGRIREARLSQAAIDVLAIVAYRQPITAEAVSKLRGRPSGHLIAQLVRRRLLEVQRTADRPRNPQYRTSGRFLQLFGLTSLGDLPQSDEA